MLKSITKKLMAMVLFSSFICVPTTAFASGLVKPADVKGGNGDGHSGGSNIYFGRYWQSYKGSGATDDKANYNYEGIRWRVLANNAATDSDGNNGLLLLSEKALYADAFQADNSTNQWKDSEIRTTLNSTTAGSGFAGDAFASKEYVAINTTTHKQGGAHTGKAATSSEKVFLLSYEDTQRVDYGFEATGLNVNSSTREVAATTFTGNVKMYGNDKVSIVYEGNACWCLRSPGIEIESDPMKYAYGVAFYGLVYDCYTVPYSAYSARPALNLASSSILFLSAATGGKSTVAVGSGFALADYTGHDYKVTIKDSTLSKPTVTLKINNGKLDGTFSGASTGARKYLSVWLLDADRKSVNYAKLANCSSAGSGSFSSLSFANVPNGKYILQFFSEEANGDYLSDYASEVYEQSVAVYGGKVTQLNPQLPTIDKTKAEFDKNAPADITFTLTNVAQIVKVTLGDEEITQYKYANGTFTLQKEAFASKATGDYLLTIKTDNGTLEATVTVKDSSLPAIDKTKAEFDKNAPADITFTLTNVEKIAKVTLGNEEISQYSYASGTFTLQKEALVSKATGDYSLKIYADNGTLEATVTVKDSSSPEPEPEPTPTPSSGGGGGGCNAGFGALALLMTLPLFCRKKK